MLNTGVAVKPREASEVGPSRLVSIGPVPGWEHIGVLSKVPGEQLIMVPSQEGDCLSLVNIDHLIVEATIPLRKGGVPWNARTTPDGKFALVTNTEFTGHADTCPTTPSTVSVVDLRKREMTAEIPVGAGPVMLEMDAVRNRAYVTNRVSGSLSVIDLASQKVIATVPVGKAPFWVGLTHGADLLVVGNFEDASLSLIDPDTLAVLNTIPVGIPGEVPDPEYGVGDTMGFAITRAGIAYVANWRSNSVVAIDLKRAVKEGGGAILGSQHVVDQPFAIELQEEMGLMIVGSYQVENSRLVILDLNTGSPGSHEKLSEIPADGSVVPEGRAAGANYWFNVPFETRVVGVKAGRSTDRLPPDIVAVIL